MGKTIRNVLDKTFKDKDFKRKKKNQKTKFFGITYGTHSTFEKDKEYYKSEGHSRYQNKTYPVKDEDFTKHNYPMEFRTKRELSNHIGTNEAKEEIKEFLQNN